MTLTNPTLVLTFTEDNTTVTLTSADICSRSVSISKQLLKDLNPASNTVDLTISRKSTKIEDIIASESDIKAELRNNGTTIFTGYLSTDYNWTITSNGEQALAITLEDVGTRLLEKEFISSGYHSFNCTVQSAVTAICAAAGVTISPAIVYPTGNVIHSVEGAKTCKELLTSLLKEFNCVYYFNASGQLLIHEVKCETTTGITEFDKTKLYTVGGTGIKLDKKIRQYKNARVTYKPTGIANNYLIYRNTTKDSDGGNTCYLLLTAGQHFDGTEKYTPEAGVTRSPAYIEAVNASSEESIVGSNEILVVTSASPVTETFGSTMTATVSIAGGKYLQLDAQNTGNITGYFRKLDVVGSIIYAKSTNIILTADEQVATTQSNNILEEELEWVHTKELAQKRANLLAQFHRYGGSTYTFYSTTAASLGSVVRLHEDAISGLDVNVMLIASKETDESDVIEYTAVGMSVFDLDAVVSESIAVAGASDTRETHIPEFLGAYETEPNGQFGDYYVSTAQATLGNVYSNNGGSWELLPLADATASKYLDAYHALQSETSLENIEGKDAVKVFTSMVAEKAVHNKLVETENFFDDITIGGSAKFTNGNIVLAQIKTVKEAAGDPTGKTLPAYSKWNVKEIFEQNITQNTVLTATGSYGSGDIGQAVKLTNPNATMYERASQVVTIAGAKTSVVTETLLQATYNCTVQISGLVACWKYQYGTRRYWSIQEQRIYKNGSLIYTFPSRSGITSPASPSDELRTISYNLDVNAGDTITYAINAHNQESGNHYFYNASITVTRETASFAQNNLNSNGLWLNTGSWQNLGINALYPSSTALSLTINGTTYAKADHYALANNFATYSSYGNNAIALNRAYKITSSNLTYNGGQVIGAYFIRNTATNASIILSDSTTITFSSTDYIYMQGTIKIAATPAGLVMQSQYPETDQAYDMGNPNAYWNDAYIVTVHGLSKRSMKKDIVPFRRNALDIINGTEVVSFRYIHDKNEIRHTGFIAEDTDSALSGPEQDSFMVNDIIGVLLKAVQELSEKVKKLGG